MLKILYFASLREAVGHTSESLGYKKNETVRELVQRLLTANSRCDTLLDPSTKVAVNQVMAGLDTVLCDGDELAFFPPVTGG